MERWTIVSLNVTFSPDHHTMPLPRKGCSILFWAQKEEKDKRRKKRMKQKKTENKKLS